MRPELDSDDDLVHHLGVTGNLDGVVVQGLDLERHDAALRGVPVTGAVFLGCRMSPALHAHAHAGGALVFPRLDDLPYRPYRPALYTPDELLAGYQRGRPDSRADSLDARIYRHAERHGRGSNLGVLEALAQRLHDHAIDDALGDLLASSPRMVAAIMGGHALARDQPAYREVAHIGRGLAERGFLVASGGGPGAMEATHLGAFVAGRDRGELDRAIAELAPAPDHHHPDWLERALAVRDRLGAPGATSLGIPTWFYGDEPFNVFATQVAKYFSNSLREDGLLAVATGGVVYAPGSAGTIQEIFMDAAQNHYGTLGVISPMVFLGVDYWTRTRPVYPLVRDLAAGRAYADLIAIVDGADQAVGFLADHPPRPPG